MTWLFDNYNKNKSNAVNCLFFKHSKAWAKYKLEKNVNHIVSPLVNFGTSSNLLIVGMNVQILVIWFFITFVLYQVCVVIAPAVKQKILQFHYHKNLRDPLSDLSRNINPTKKKRELKDIPQGGHGILQ